MKSKMKITRNNTTLFEGKLINLPIKEEFIIKKSVELFDDEDPCIIHQSYVVKEYANCILEAFAKNNSKELLGKDFVSEFEFLDFTNIIELKFELMG